MTAEEKWKEALALLDSEQANEHGEEILQLLNEAISEGHAGAIFTMATLYYFGNGPLTQDRQKGLSLAQEALDKGYERAKRMLGYECLVGSSGPIDLQKGEQYYKDLVEGGHADACLQLATFYLDGTIPGKGYQDGLELIDKAFKLGNANVYLESADFFGKYCEDEKMNEMISRHLSYGGTVPQEFYDSYSPETLSSRRITLFRHFCEISQFDKAIAALKEGVSNGEIESEETLADIYLYGLGEDQYERDIDLALKIFMSLSERGSGFADFRLAQYYRSFAENMEDENYQMAMNYLRKSVDKGYAHAQLVMARIVLEQDKDQVLAKQYLESAAEGADPEALRVLGESYLQDSEIVPDSDFIYELDAKKGIDYLIAAAQCNEPVAMYYLSKCYRDGKYVDKNELFAMELLRRSVASSPNADNLLLLADFYKDGTGVDKDLEAAFDINKSVAD
ncbi:MAG: sel1 repeat family protein, partial [Bacteroidales bacterium]|nr:sel1 repeat family protein [Bacteroidales bacterium]